VSAAKDQVLGPGKIAEALVHPLTNCLITVEGASATWAHG
jgi:hypothetical protein